jgi:hypothetical protein
MCAVLLCPLPPPIFVVLHVFRYRTPALPFLLSLLAASIPQSRPLARDTGGTPRWGKLLKTALTALPSLFFTEQHLYPPRAVRCCKTLVQTLIAAHQACHVVTHLSSVATQRC